VLLERLANCLVNPQLVAQCFIENFSSLSHYTHYFTHLEKLIKEVQKLPGFETDCQFPLAPVVSSKGDNSAESGSGESTALWNRRNSLSFRYLLELADLPRIRLVAYRGLLRDLARYTARAESDTQDLEQAMICIARLSRRSEEGISLWQLMEPEGEPFEQFQQTYYNKETGMILPPALIRLTDLKINERHSTKTDNRADQNGRLVLMPGYLVFLQRSTLEEQMPRWKICWMHPIRSFRIGEEDTTSDVNNPWFDLWNVNSDDPVKHVLRVYCHDAVSQKAWLLDLREDLMSQLGCDLSGTEVSSQVIREHQEADLERRLRYAVSMELPELRDETIGEVFLDAIDNAQQIQPELVTQRSHAQPTEMEINQVSSTFDKSYRSEESVSSSYHTAEEPPDEELNCRTHDTSVTLYESYTTLDSVTTPFSEDQQSLLDEQFAGDGLRLWRRIFSVKEVSRVAPPLQTKARTPVRCRLFEGTETAVYFYVNVTPKESEVEEAFEEMIRDQEASDSKVVSSLAEDRSIQLQESPVAVFVDGSNEAVSSDLEKIVEQNLSTGPDRAEFLTAITSLMDVAVGQVLELRVKVDRQKAQKATGNPINWEHAISEWCCDGQPLTASSKCRMYEDGDTVVLQICTSDCLPGVQFNYSFSLQLSQETQPYQVTIPVHVHSPTKDELSAGFIPVDNLLAIPRTGLRKVVSISEMLDIQLIQGQKFRLIASLDSKLCSDDPAIWWTLNGNQIASRGRDDDSRDLSEFRCFLNRMTNAVKLTKPAVDLADAGLYVCWLDDSDGHTGPAKKVIEYSVSVLTADEGGYFDSGDLFVESDDENVIVMKKLEPDSTVPVHPVDQSEKVSLERETMTLAEEHSFNTAHATEQDVHQTDLAVLKTNERIEQADQNNDWVETYEILTAEDNVGRVVGKNNEMLVTENLVTLEGGHASVGLIVGSKTEHVEEVSVEREKEGDSGPEDGTEPKQRLEGENRKITEEEEKRMEWEKEQQRLGEEEIRREQEEEKKTREEQEKKKLENKEKKRLKEEEAKRQQEELETEKQKEGEEKKREEEKKRRLEEEEMERKQRKEEEEKRRDEEGKRLAEEEAKRQKKKREEEKKRLEEEEKRKREEEKRRLEEEEEKRRDEEKRRLEEEEKKKREEEKKRLEEEEKRKREEDKRKGSKRKRKKKREERKRKRLEEEEKKKREEEKKRLEKRKRKRNEKKEKKRLEEEEKRKQERERRLEEEEKKKREEEKRRLEEEEKKKREEEKKRLEEEEKKKREEEKKRLEEEEKKKREEEKKRLEEEEKKRREEEKKRLEEEEKKRRDEEEKRLAGKEAKRRQEGEKTKLEEGEKKRLEEGEMKQDKEERMKQEENEKQIMEEGEKEVKWQQEEGVKKKHEEERGKPEEEINQKKQKKREKKQENAEKRRRESESETLREGESEKKREEKKERKKGGGKKTEQEVEKEQSGEPKGKEQDGGEKEELKEEEERGKEGQEGNRGVKDEGEEEGRKVRRKEEKDAKRKEKKERGREKQHWSDLEKAHEKEETDDLQSGETIKEHVKKGDEEKRKPDQEMKTEEYDRHEKRREGQGRGRELENKDNKNSGTIERDVVTKSIEIEAVNVMQTKEERDDIRETMESKAKLMDEKKNKTKKRLPEGEPKISETNDAVVLAEAVEGNLLIREYETVDGNLKKPETDRETPATEKLKIGDRNIEDVEDKAEKSHKKGKRKSKGSHAECKKLEDLGMSETQSELEGETMRKQSEDNYRTQLPEDMNKEEKREKKLKKSKKHGKPEESHLNEYEGWSQQRLAEDLVNLAQQADLGPSELRFGSTADWVAQRSEKEKHRRYGDATESLDESVGLFDTSVSPELHATSLSPVTVKSYKEQDERVISEAFVVDPVEPNKLRVLVNRAFDLSERYVVQVLEGTPLSMELQSIPIEAVRAVWSRRKETIQDVLIDRVNRQTAESESLTESITDTGNLCLQFSSFDSQDVDTYRLDLYVPVGPRPELEPDHDEISEAKYELLKSIEIPVELVKRYPEPKRRDGQQQRQQQRQQLFSIVDEICTNLDYPVRETASVCLAVQCPNQGLEMTDSDFEWLCDGQPIVFNSSDRFHPDVIFESNPTRFLTKLIIPSVRKCDTGQYTIRLTSAGRARLQHAIEDDGLKVRMPVTDYTEFAFPRLRVQPLISEREIVEDERDASTFFDKGLPSHCSFREAERATLEVRLNPAVRIQDYMWFFNGKPINTPCNDLTYTENLCFCRRCRSCPSPPPSHLIMKPETTADFSLSRLGNTLSITFPHVRPDLTGNYEVWVLGDQGSVTSSTRVDVQAKNDRDTGYRVTSADGLKPLFTKRLHDCEIHVLRTFVLGVEHVEHDYFDDDDYEEVGEVAVHETDIRKPTTALPNEAPQLRVTNFDPSSFTVDWKPLMQTGVTYTVELSKDGGKWWRPVLTGLQNTSAYITSELGSPLIPLQIRVLAENEYGLGPASTPIQIPIRACLPVMPDIRPEIEFEDASSVLIRWPSATPSVGESQMLGDHVITPLAMLGSVTYAVELREGARAEWRRVTDNIHGQTHVHHLRPGVSSAIRIVAVNKFGESSPTPIAITHLDPSSLAPNIDLAPPWVALIRPHTETGSRPGSTAQIGLVMYWKPAYMPEYCESCVKGLDPVYRIEWRRGRGGIWQLLEDDVTDPETGFRLPAELVSMLLDDLKRVGEPTNSNNQALELRVFSWNQFGESGPTKPCRLFASQLFRGQIYKNTALALDRDQAPEFPEHWNDADQLPTVSLPEQCPRLNTYIHSINPTDGVSVSWQRYVDTGLLSGTEINPDSHARYRIERAVSSSDHRSPLLDQRIAWRVTSVDEALIYGENCVLDLRPSKTEQYVRVLALNEARNRRVWVDAYKLIRIPPLSELIPSSPTTVTVHAQPTTDSNATSSVEHVIQWIPAEQTSWFNTRPANRDHDNLGHEEPDSSNPSDLHYRIEARTALSDMAPWRQIAVVEHDSTSTIDRKPEPGMQLIYRVTPINIFGEGQSAVSAPIRTPVMFVNLEGRAPTSALSGSTVVTALSSAHWAALPDLADHPSNAIHPGTKSPSLTRAGHLPTCPHTASFERTVIAYRPTRHPPPTLKRRCKCHRATARRAAPPLARPPSRLDPPYALPWRAPSGPSIRLSTSRFGLNIYTKHAYSAHPAAPHSHSDSSEPFPPRSPPLTPGLLTPHAQLRHSENAPLRGKAPSGGAVCVEDLRYTILGPREIQLRWRLGDVAIDSLKHELDHGGQRMIPRSASMDVADRVRYNVEIRSGYAGEWTPVVENIRGNLTGKTALTDCEYLNRDIACRVIAYLEGQRTVPSRPVQLKLKTESLVPDLSLSKPHVSVESLDEYVISWEEPDVREIYPSHVLGLTTPQVLHRGMTYQVQVQRDGSKIWEDLSPVIQETLWTWSRPNPLKSYHVRLIAFNEFGPGMPSRAVAVPAQVVIPDLSFIRPTVELPADILAGATAPELVWQLPRAYTLDKTLTPVTYEVQVRGVARSARSPQQMIEENKHSVEDDECVWRVLETNLRRTRLALGRLDPEQEFWLRVVAVTDYGRGKPSQPVRKMVDLAARRLQRASASIGTLHEATPISPTFIDPKGAVMFAPLGGRLELKCSLKSMPINSDIRFSWFLNDRPIRTSETAYPQGTNRFMSQVSKTGDSATLHIDGITDADFGVYSCRAVNIRGTALKEFTVIKADSPVFLDVPVPVLTIRLHSEFVLPCWVDALPEATLIWTRDSKRVVESHRTKIGAGPATPRLTSRTSKSLWQTTNASLSVERCIYQDAGLYTLVAENVAGRVQTSCLVRIEENPIHKEVSIRWTDIGKHYYVLRKIEGQMANEMRLLINKRTNQEYVGKLFPLDDPANRVCGAREFECLSRLNHTNVVELIDAVICDNTLVLIMEHLTGSNLLQAMLHCPTWSESVARAVVRQLLEALEHLHAAGVVHFDIHPENLIFARNLVANSWDSPTAYTDLFAALSPLVTDTMGSGETDRHKLNVLSTLIKLVGFSAAEPLLSEQTGGCLPPHRYRCEYTSPEVLLALAQVEHDVTESASVSIGTAADMWSVGVLTYLLLTGWNPFMDPSTGEILRRNILNAEYSMDLEEFANVSEEAKSFIRALLQKDPSSSPEFVGRDFETMSNASITSVDDASEEINMKLSTILRQDTLTEASQFEDGVDEHGVAVIHDPAATPTEDSAAGHGGSPKITAPSAAPVLACPLRDAYYNTHLREARFSCQLAGFTHLPPGIHGHREAIQSIYSKDCSNVSRTKASSAAAVAAWYLGGCLLSDGPGVELGAGPGGWLWLCLTDLNPEQSGSVVECVIRNRAGKARTQARLLQADPPRPPGRPGLSDVRATEALVTWAPTDPTLNEDIIYRVDAKYSAGPHEPLSWYPIGFTVDCRYLITDLTPGRLYRVRVSAGNVHGWGNYSVASSEFQTANADPPEYDPILSNLERDWILTWRQNSDITALSDHPIAVRFNMSRTGSMPPPLSDKALQKLHENGGLISDLEVLREVSYPEYVLKTMTGRCPQKPLKPEPTATETPKTGDTSKPPAGPHSRSKRRGESSGPATDTAVSGSITHAKVIPIIEFRRLNAFTKPAKKFVYNTVRQVPA
ncbi:putative Neurofilament protein, partial [Fasciola gigantica]